MNFEQAIAIDPEIEADRIGSGLRDAILKTLRKRGAVLGVSGGVDSAVVLGLCVRCMGAANVRALIMPERDSDPESKDLAIEVARRFGVIPAVEDISRALEGFGCYERRDSAIRRLVPEYDAGRGYRSKITLPPNLLQEDTLNVPYLTVVRPDGSEISLRLPAQEFRQILAASNFKQRARMSMMYFHAELNNCAVIGTANRNEHELGFFVKYGDGGVDVRPIAHLYKTQVYQLARFLRVPEEIIDRAATTDTFSAPSTQEEFFFRVPFDTMDQIWFGMERGLPAREIAESMNLSDDQVKRVCSDLVRKHRTTEHLRVAPINLTEGAN